MPQGILGNLKCMLINPQNTHYHADTQLHGIYMGRDTQETWSESAYAEKKKKKQTDLGFNFGLMSCDLELVLSGPHGICKMGAVLVPVSLGVAGTQQMLVSYPLPLAGNGNSDIEGKERTGRSVKLWGERALGEGP